MNRNERLPVQGGVLPPCWYPRCHEHPLGRHLRLLPPSPLVAHHFSPARLVGLGFASPPNCPYNNRVLGVEVVVRSWDARETLNRHSS